MSAWENFNGPFNFGATTLGPIGCPVIIHNKTNVRKNWDFRGRKGFNIGPALNHYRCFHVVDSVTVSLLFSDTVKFLHAYLTQPTITKGNRIENALNFLSSAVKDAPTTTHHAQLTTISKIRDILNNCIPRTSMDLSTPLLDLATTEVPATPPPTAERKATTQSIRDVLFMQTQPSFADQNPIIAIDLRVVTPPPRVVPLNF